MDILKVNIMNSKYHLPLCKVANLNEFLKKITFLMIFNLSILLAYVLYNALMLQTFKNFIAIIVVDFTHNSLILKASIF